MISFLPQNMTPKARARFGFIRAVFLIVLGSVFLFMSTVLLGIWQMLGIIIACSTLLAGYAYALFGVCGLWHEQECAEPTGVFPAEILGSQANSSTKEDDILQIMEDGKEGTKTGIRKDAVPPQNNY